MPIQLSCPSCGRALRVPDTLVNQAVKCPNCETTFHAAPAAAPARDAFREPADAPVRPRDDDLPARPRPRLDRQYDADDDDDEEVDELEFRRRRRRRSHLTPHRGGTVLTFGILSIALSFAICPLIGLIGIAAWVMGMNDLREMREGRMNPDGHGQTKTGMILGIVGTGLGILSVLGIVVLVAVNA